MGTSNSNAQKRSRITFKQAMPRIEAMHGDIDILARIFKKKSAKKIADKTA